ncbi:MAG TPA: hypothetical protein VFG84_03575 [Gemmatimonadaceae bacterium]|nr:hypothetical protein [Gemmatimonadaceae bacterium]
MSERIRRSSAPFAATIVALLVALLVAAPPSMLHAQVSVLGAQGAVVAAAAVPSITLNVTGGAQHVSSLQDGEINDFPLPLTISTGWDGAPLLSTLCIVSYFQNPASALSNGTASIPSSRIQGRLTTNGSASAWTAYTQSGCAGGSGPNGGSFKLTSLLLLGGTDTGTGTLELRIDLRGQPDLAPGLYAGTLNLRAVIQ